MRERSRRRGPWLVSGLAAACLITEGCRAPGPGTIPEPPLDGAEPSVVEAVRSARAAVESAPSSAEAWGRLGDRYAAHTWDREAAACYLRAERLEPRRFLWPYLQGHALGATDLERSAVAFARAVERDPRYAQARYFLARALHRLGRLDEAEAEYREAIAADRSLSHAWLGLGLLALERGRLEEARPNLERALELEAGHREAHLALSRVWLGLGDEPRARQHADRAREAPSDPPAMPDPRRERDVPVVGTVARSRIARQLLREGKPDEAAAHYEALLRDRPRYPEALFNLGEAREAQGRAAEAIELYRRTLELAPDHTSAHHKLGTWLSRNGRAVEALPHLRRVVESRPGALAGRLHFGIALSQAGRIEEAIPQFRAAVEIAPEDAEARYNLGVVLAMAGQTADATTQLEHAARLDPTDPAISAALQQVRAGH